MTAQQGSSLLSGSGGLSLAATLGLQAATIFAGTGALAADTRFVLGTGLFLGAGALAGTTTLNAMAGAAWLSSGRMCAQATVRLGRRGPVNNVVEFGSGPSINITVGGGSG